MELSIDTSTNTAGLALSLHGEIIEAISWQTEYNHTIELIPKMINLLERNNKDIHDLKAVTVAQGPGSFNGLRVGIATAKGLALSLHVPVASICTLEAIAYPHANTEMKTCAVLQAGRGEIAAALFQLQADRSVALEEPHITSVSNLCSKINDKTMFCGEITQDQLDHIRQEAAKNAHFETAEFRGKRVGYLAKLGWCRIYASNFDDPAVLQPL